MKSNDYPYLKCLSPKRLLNPYSHKHILATCGKCAACLQRASDIRTLKCKLESNYNDYCYFITLTYSENYIPSITLLQHDSNTDLMLLNERLLPIRSKNETPYMVTNRIGTQDNHYYATIPNVNYVTASSVYLDKCQTSLSEYIYITSRTTNKKINVLYKPDVQLFLKRLRKQISKLYPNEKIRYYVTGEYGPTTFRPHFHLLLWFNSKKLSENLDKHLSESWLYGNIDSEKAVNAASYVAQYVNCSSNLPSLLTHSNIKPFTLHSQYLGEKTFETKDEILSDSTALDFTRRRVSVCGTPTDVNAWRSVNNRRYPKCRKYSQVDSSSTYNFYCLARTAKTAFGENLKLIDLAKTIQFTYYNLVSLYDKLKSSPNFNSILSCMDYYSKFICNHQLVSADEKQTYLRTLYIDLLTSNRFLKNINYDNNKVSSYIKKIDKFYSELEYENLKNQIQTQDYIISKTGCIDDINYLYANLPESHLTQKTPFYSSYRTITNQRLTNSVKHKKLNDKNNILKN